MALRKTHQDLRNPFVIGGIVRDSAFTDRLAEIARIRAALGEPQAKLLVYGPRRMGKTSALDRAILETTAAGGLATRADLSGCTTLADVSTRVMQAVALVVGRRWKDAVTSFVSGLNFSFTMTPDPATGLLLPGVSVQQRTEALEVQRAALESTLAAADAFAGSRGVTVGIVLDEFQTIHKFGGEAAEWHLRSLLQTHGHLAYVAAGSEVGLINGMVGDGRAFYKLFEVMSFGAIDPDHMSGWIEQRMAEHGVTAVGCGRAIVEAAGPRTRDIVQLARSVFTEALPHRAADLGTVRTAFGRIVNEEAEILRVTWENFATAQQNVLRAIAVGAARLHSAATRRQFGLKSTAEVNQALRYLLRDHVVVETGGSYFLDSPFFAGWIRQHMLADVGLNQDIMQLAPQREAGGT